MDTPTPSRSTLLMAREPTLPLALVLWSTPRTSSEVPLLAILQRPRLKVPPTWIPTTVTPTRRSGTRRLPGSRPIRLTTTTLSSPPITLTIVATLCIRSPSRKDRLHPRPLLLRLRGRVATTATVAATKAMFAVNQIAMIQAPALILSMDARAPMGKFTTASGMVPPARSDLSVTSFECAVITVANGSLSHEPCIVFFAGFDGLRSTKGKIDCFGGVFNGRRPRGSTQQRHPFQPCKGGAGGFSQSMSFCR
mmetsp:Transcript_31186/g.58124  ORF Transcript_31186/g.58124 Transcript_31186/m.58124 type:complete len:251 (+) Transcript_31186:627-1379(+)